jgi:V8-like Glu-specific endopeptidase
MILSLSEATCSQIKKISVYGYPIKTNQNDHSNKTDQSSIFMKNQYAASGPIKKVKDFRLTYQMPTEAGISGGPVFT